MSLPIEIISFLSIDPPPSSVISAPAGIHRGHSFANAIHESDSEAGDHNSDTPDHEDQDEQEYKYGCGEGHGGTGNLHLYDDTDEVVQHAVLHARVDAEYGKSAPRFSDLYYSSLHDDANHGRHKRLGYHPEAVVGELEETPVRNRFKTRFEEKKREYERRRTLIDGQLALEETIADTMDPLDSGYFPPVDSSKKDEEKCTCGSGGTDPLRAELPKPPKPLTRSLASSPDTKPLSGGYEAPYGDIQSSLNRTLEVPCQTPGQISSPSIPRAGTVKDKIRTLEALEDAALQ